MLNYRILPEHKLLVLCIWGMTSVEEIQKQRQKIRTSIDFSQNYDTIIEVTHLKRWFTSEEMHTFSKSTSDAYMSGKKLAIVASSDIAYGMNRMYEAMSDLESPLEISVFRDVSSALKWLGREGIDIESIFKEIMGEVK
jgi:hypothetical protein